MHGDRLDNVMVPHDFPVHLVTNADRAERAQRAHGMSSASTGSRGLFRTLGHTRVTEIGVIYRICVSQHDRALKRNCA